MSRRRPRRRTHDRNALRPPIAEPSASPRRSPSKAGLAVAAALALLIVAAAVGVWSGSLPGPGIGSLATTSPAAGASGAVPTLDPLEPLTIESIQRRPHVVFQNVIRNEDYAAVSLVAVDAPAGARLATDLVCERVHFAGGRGLCLAGEHDEQSTYHALLFDDRFTAGARIDLDGAPTFAQVSRDGRYGSVSVQTTPPTAENPLAPTRTWLVDMAEGRMLADLATFRVTRDGTEIVDAAMDVWGVTFQQDSRRFFASLRTAGNTYLVEGNLDDRRLVVVAPNVSAPSLSPDGTRLAYAKLVSNIGPTWRFHVLDLATMEESPLSEARSIDEQPEWLDDGTILYGLATDTWSVEADGTGDPRPFIFNGLSPSVVR